MVETILRREAWYNRGFKDRWHGRAGHTIECVWCDRTAEIDFEAPKLPSGWFIKKTRITDWKGSQGYLTIGGNLIFCSQDCCNEAEWEDKREPWEPLKYPYRTSERYYAPATRGEWVAVAIYLSLLFFGFCGAAHSLLMGVLG
jgi:hypothetical protein